jgi:hypothetical protein
MNQKVRANLTPLLTKQTFKEEEGRKAEHGPSQQSPRDGLPQASWPHRPWSCRATEKVKGVNLDDDGGGGGWWWVVMMMALFEV